MFWENFFAIKLLKFVIASYCQVTGFRCSASKHSIMWIVQVPIANGVADVTKEQNFVLNEWFLGEIQTLEV